MAMACLGFVTFLPLRPDLSLPFFISFISVSTLLPAAGEYLRPEDFFAEDLFVEGFLLEDFFALLLLLVLLFFAEELLFLMLLDFFFAAFFVAIFILLENQMACRFESVVWRMLCRERVCYTTRRKPGTRTSGSAMTQQAMHVSVPVMQNFRSAGATRKWSRRLMPTNTGG